MPSPFPGMNPYLEQEDVWEDFHHNGKYIYAESPDPPLSPTDTAWARQLVPTGL